MTVMRVGIGLGAIPIIGVCLDLFHIPLYASLFFVLALIVPGFDFIKSLKSKNTGIQWKRLDIQTIGLLIIFLVSFGMYSYGSFQNWWLEDDDPWFHAAGVKYVAVENNVSPPSGTFQYINPYPPGYDILLGLLHQSNPSLLEILKLFNSLIIALGFLFFYFFVKEFSRDKQKAFYATLFLACIPCYLSHFIWAHALAVTLFFPAFYTILKSFKERKFQWSAIIILASIIVTQNSQALKLIIFIFLMALAFSIIYKKRPLRFIKIIFLALLLSCAWWVPRGIQLMQGSLNRTVETCDQMFESQNLKQYEHLRIEGTRKIPLSESKNFEKLVRALFNPYGGTATRAYDLLDYIYLKGTYNYINNPIGVGLPLFLLSWLGLFCTLKLMFSSNNNVKFYVLTIMLWSLFTFLGINSSTFHLPVGLFAFRFWMLFAIPVCLLAAEGIIFIKQKVPQNLSSKIILILIFSILWTSGKEKWSVNTGIWPWGECWASRHEIKGYALLKNHLPLNTKVFSFTNNMFVIGHDMLADFWSSDYQKNFKNSFQFDVKKLSSVL